MLRDLKGEEKLIKEMNGGRKVSVKQIMLFKKYKLL